MKLVGEFCRIRPLSVPGMLEVGTRTLRVRVPVWEKVVDGTAAWADGPTGVYVEWYRVVYGSGVYAAEDGTGRVRWAGGSSPYRVVYVVTPSELAVATVVASYIVGSDRVVVGRELVERFVADEFDARAEGDVVVVDFGGVVYPVADAELPVVLNPDYEPYSPIHTVDWMSTVWTSGGTGDASRHSGRFEKR